MPTTGTFSAAGRLAHRVGGRRPLPGLARLVGRRLPVPDSTGGRPGSRCGRDYARRRACSRCSRCTTACSPAPRAKRVRDAARAAGTRAIDLHVGGQPALHCRLHLRGSRCPARSTSLHGPLRSSATRCRLAGLLLTIRSSAALDVLDLAGVRQVQRARDGAPPRHVALETRGLYGFVRHPLYFAWALMVFGAPDMTATRATFAIVSTGYLALAIPWEERSLMRDLRSRVPMPIDARSGGGCCRGSTELGLGTRTRGSGLGRWTPYDERIVITDTHRAEPLRSDASQADAI